MADSKIQDEIENEPNKKRWWLVHKKDKEYESGPKMNTPPYPIKREYQHRYQKDLALNKML